RELRWRCSMKRRFSLGAVILIWVFFCRVVSADTLFPDTEKNLLVANEVASYIPLGLWYGTSGPRSPGTVSIAATYDATGWTLLVNDRFLGQPVSLNYVGTFNQATNTATWVGNGTFGSASWSDTGSALFSGLNDQFLDITDHIHIGTTGGFTAPPDSEIVTDLLIGAEQFGKISGTEANEFTQDVSGSKLGIDIAPKIQPAPPPPPKPDRPAQACPAPAAKTNPDKGTGSHVGSITKITTPGGTKIEIIEYVNPSGNDNDQSPGGNPGSVGVSGMGQSSG